jgi:Lipocalin-like domain
MREPVRIVPDMILGTWRLTRTYTTLDGKFARADPLGVGAHGFVHYMPDNRMAVLIAAASRKPVAGSRYNAPEAELAEAARTFTAYGGTYTCGIGRVVHHLEISNYENDNRSDYVREAVFDEAGLLTLTTPGVPTAEGIKSTCLVWERMSVFPK